MYCQPMEIGPLEIVALLLVAVLLFGAKRLPEIGRSLGKGMREFKESVSGITDVKTDTVKSIKQATGLQAPDDDDI